MQKVVHRVKKNICLQIFYKIVALEILQNSQENTYVGVLINKVARIMRAHHKYSNEVFFLITPQNQTTLQLKQISKVQ